MERERAARVVKMEDGREGVLLETEGTRVKVRLDDGTEEWVELASVTEKAAEGVPPRELGS